MDSLLFLKAYMLNLFGSNKEIRPKEALFFLHMYKYSLI